MEQTQNEIVHKGKYNSTTSGKVIYTAKTHTVGGRAGGHARSDDGEIEVDFASPGTGKKGTNPEQMFAAGWSACFIGAMGVAAIREKVALPKDSAVDADVDLMNGGPGDFSLQARLHRSEEHTSELQSH